MLPREDRVRVQHMLDAARKARSLSAGRSRGDLGADEEFSLALQRLIEILGEAGKKVSAPTRSRTTDIPWKAIAGMRDRLIHAYFDVDLDILWDTVTEDLPTLMTALEALLKTEPPF